MSIVTDRAEIAAALDGVIGVRGHQYRPTTPRPGDAWPTLPTLELQDSIVWRPTWTIIVFLPQDERASSIWIDAHFLDIVAALRSGPIFPESAEPGLMPTNRGDQYVLEIAGRS